MDSGTVKLTKHNMAKDKKPKSGKKLGPKKPGAGYDVECVYQYLKAAGGSVDKAIRLAEEAKDRRVPSTRKTWFLAAARENMRERYKKETVEEWKAFHGEREAKKQHMLDRVAFAIEPLIMEYGVMLEGALKKLREKKDYELAILRKDFALGPEVFDKMVRLYCRAMGMPERITHSSHEVRNTTILTYEEAEEQKKMSAEGRITRPMVASDLEGARALMETIDLGPEWDIEDEKVS